MRILILANSAPLVPAAGSDAVAEKAIVAHFLPAVARALVRKGCEVLIVAPRLGNGIGWKDGGLTVRPYEWTGSTFQAIAKIPLMQPKGWKAIFDLARAGSKAALDAAREFRPDACLAAFALPSGYFARRAAAEIGVPYVVWCLGSDIHTYAKLPVFRQLTRRILKDSLRNYADGFELAKDTSKISGRPTEFLATSIPIAAMPKSVATAPRVRFLYSGRLEPVKGFDVLLEAWAQLVKQRPGRCHLTVAGDGAGQRRLLEAALEDPALASTIDWKGALPHGEFVKLYGEADFAVIPSRRESIPVVFSEAVQCGVPLITSDAGDMADLVARYKLGISVPREDSSALSNAMRQAIDGGVVLDPAGKKAFLHLMDVDSSADKLLQDLSQR